MATEHTRQSLEGMFEYILRETDSAERTHEDNILAMFQRLSDAVDYSGGKYGIPLGELQPFVDGYVEIYNRDREARQKFMKVYGYGKLTRLLGADYDDTGLAVGSIFLTAAATLAVGIGLAPLAGPFVAATSALTVFLGGWILVEEYLEKHMDAYIEKQDPAALRVIGYAEHVQFYADRDELAHRTIDRLLAEE